MREAGLPPQARPAWENRDRGFKKAGFFVCASPHNPRLCNADHTSEPWGVA
ncbi:hypothetical protein FHW74_001581 [Atlantibacter sp. RC6]|nr:hypothetical protein [Atlantibacter sp. RC6]